MNDLYAAFSGGGRGGYLVVPRVLLEKVFETDAVLTPAQLYLFLYMRCEFCDRTGKDALKRGQLVCTSAGLAKVAGWSGSSVRLFLRSLAQCGLVKKEVIPGKGLKLTLCRYEEMTGGHGRPVTEADRKEFAAFWRQYYDLLERHGTDYVTALSEWGRLRPGERKMAAERMERYFCSLNDIRFVKSATNYLRDRVFFMPDDVDTLR